MIPALRLRCVAGAVRRITLTGWCNATIGRWGRCSGLRVSPADSAGARASADPAAGLGRGGPSAGWPAESAGGSRHLNGDSATASDSAERSASHPGMSPARRPASTAFPVTTAAVASAAGGHAFEVAAHRLSIVVDRYPRAETVVCSDSVTQGLKDGARPAVRGWAADGREYGATIFRMARIGGEEELENEWVGTKCGTGLRP